MSVVESEGSTIQIWLGIYSKTDEFEKVENVEHRQQAVGETYEEKYPSEKIGSTANAETHTYMATKQTSAKKTRQK